MDPINNSFQNQTPAPAPAPMQVPPLRPTSTPPTPPVQTPQAPMTPPPVTPIPTNSQRQSRKIGPIISIFVVVVIIIAIILYFVGSNSNRQAPIPTDNASVATQDSNTNQIPVSVQPITNKTDDVESLQNDLNNSTTGVDSQNF